MQDRTAPITPTSASTAREIILRRPIVALRNKRLLRRREKKDVPGRREKVNIGM